MPMKPTDSILALPRGSMTRANFWAVSNGAKRLSEVEAYVREVYRLAPLVGLDPAIVIAQSAHETDSWDSFWWETRLNSCGLGITGDPAQNAASKTWANGTDAARAQIVHLSAYVYGDWEDSILGSLRGPSAGMPWDALYDILSPYKHLDPRFDALYGPPNLYGTVKTLNDLTGRWATDPRYAEKIAELGTLIFPGLGGGTPPVATPIIYDIRNDADAARFGLTRGERDYLLSRCFPNRNGGDPRAILVHIQDGNTVGSVDWWVHGFVNGVPVQASATVMIQRDGSILRVIPEQHGPWTNGKVERPTAASAKLRSYGGNPNNFSLTIENEGEGGKPLTAVQFASNVWQIEQWQAKHGIPDDQFLGHFTLDQVDRPNCPDPPPHTLIYAPLKAAIGAGTTPVPVPPPPTPVDNFGIPGLDLALAKARFGRVVFEGVTYVFNPTGPLSNLWLDRARETGVYAPLVTIERFDTRRYFGFSDGWTCWTPNDQAAIRIQKG